MITTKAAIRKLEHAASRLIPDTGDPHVISRAFGYGTTAKDSRVQAGILLQNLANELWREQANEVAQ